MNRFKTLRTFLAIAFLLMTITGYGQNKEAKPNVLIITGTGIPASGHYQDWHHDHYNQHLIDALDDFSNVVVTEDLNVLNDDFLKQFSVIVNNSLFKEPTRDQLASFFRFIESGKGYFAIHAGLVSFINTEKYYKLIGGKFINHDEIKTFTVNTYDAWYGWEAESRKHKHAITKEISDFKILDELYLVEFNTPDIEVIARAELHPVMWTKSFGRGSVLCLTLGHGEFSQSNAGFQRLFSTGVEWLVEQQTRK